MASKPLNVLRVNSVEETMAFRAAVARVLTNIQHDHGLTLQEIAETIDVSLGTISNAANKKTDLSPTYQQRLARAFGCSVLDPIAKLSGGQIIPIKSDGGADILPLLSRAALAVAEARDPESEGGVTETHREKLNQLPYLRRVHAELSALIVSIEGIAA